MPTTVRSVPVSQPGFELKHLGDFLRVDDNGRAIFTKPAHIVADDKTTGDLVAPPSGDQIALADLL